MSLQPLPTARATQGRMTTAFTALVSFFRPCSFKTDHRKDHTADHGSRQQSAPKEDEVIVAGLRYGLSGRSRLLRRGLVRLLIES